LRKTLDRAIGIKIRNYQQMEVASYAYDVILLLNIEENLISSSKLIEEKEEKKMVNIK